MRLCYKTNHHIKDLHFIPFSMLQIINYQTSLFCAIEIHWERKREAGEVSKPYDEKQGQLIKKK
jgi:hypothetical protein